MSDDPPDPDRAAKRPSGRPRVAEPGAAVTTWVRANEYDRLLRLANAREQSLSSLVRALVLRSLK